MTSRRVLVEDSFVNVDNLFLMNHIYFHLEDTKYKFVIQFCYFVCFPHWVQGPAQPGGAPLGGGGGRGRGDAADAAAE